MIEEINKKPQVQKIGWFVGISFWLFYDNTVIGRCIRHDFFFVIPDSLGGIYCIADD